MASVSLKALALCVGTTFSLAAALASGAAGGSGQSSRRAQNLLFASLRRSFEINVIAIVEQRAAAGAAYQFQIKQNEDGMFVSTVLTPLREQGHTVVDDGSKSYTLRPDQRVLIEQNSQRKLLEDAAKRQELTLKNYRIQMGPEATVAGRSVFSVVAVPRSEMMPARRFYIDEETLFPLKVVIVPPDGAPEVRLETKMVQFPDKLPDSKLGLPTTVGSLRRERIEQVKISRQSHKELRRLPFKAKMPEELPLGFELQSAEVHKNDGCGSLVLRLSDGLSHATVIQYSPQGRLSSVENLPGLTRYNDGKVSYKLYSDLPDDIRLRLLAGVVGVAWEKLVELEAVSRARKAVRDAEGFWVPNREPVKKPHTLNELSEKSPLPTIAHGGCSEQEPEEKPKSYEERPPD